jgi:hypothetical protein
VTPGKFRLPQKSVTLLSAEKVILLSAEKTITALTLRQEK